MPSPDHADERFHQWDELGSGHAVIAWRIKAVDQLATGKRFEPAKTALGAVGHLEGGFRDHQCRPRLATATNRAWTDFDCGLVGGRNGFNRAVNAVIDGESGALGSFVVANQVKSLLHVRLNAI